MGTRFSVVIPAFRAAKFLERNLQLVKQSVEKITPSYEIIIVEDGNIDGTDKIAARLAAEDKRIKHLHNDNRLGRGGALLTGFKAAKGSIVSYLDVDLEISPAYLATVVEKLGQGNDIAIVSKHHSESNVESTAQRLFLSRGYNWLVRAVLGSKIKCHQGGMKGFKKNAIERILPLVQDNWWFWDTEVLLLGQWLGLKEVEIPIRASYGFQDTTVVNWKDCLRMLAGIAKLKKRRLTELRSLGKA